MFTVANDGPNIKFTNYWQSEHAAAGLCYLSANAGSIRLLVPVSAEGYLPEMRTGKSASIEPSLHDPRCIDVVFEDGTDSPFSLAVDKRQIDRAIKPGKCNLVVYTQNAGIVLSLGAIVAEIPLNRDQED